MIFAEVFAIVVLTIIGVLFLLVFVVLPVVMAVTEKTPLRCVFIDHKPYDEHGIKVPKPKGLIAGLAATFTSRELVCRRCGHAVMWVGSHEIWTIRR